MGDKVLDDKQGNLPIKGRSSRQCWIWITRPCVSCNTDTHSQWRSQDLHSMWTTALSSSSTEEPTRQPSIHGTVWPIYYRRIGSCHQRSFSDGRGGLCTGWWLFTASLFFPRWYCPAVDISPQMLTCWGRPPDSKWEATCYGKEDWRNYSMLEFEDNPRNTASGQGELYKPYVQQSLISHFSNQDVISGYLNRESHGPVTSLLSALFWRGYTLHLSAFLWCISEGKPLAVVYPE